MTTIPKGMLPSFRQLPYLYMPAGCLLQTQAQSIINTPIMTPAVFENS